MSDHTSKQTGGASLLSTPVLDELGLPLEELVRRGARQLIQRAIEVEVEALLGQYETVTLLDGRRAVVRNGHLPEREILTGIGPVPVQIPKVRDRSGSGVKFNSSLVPPYVRRTPRVSAALPWLYLKGVSSGDLSEALKVLLGEDAKGLSPNVLGRLKAQWAQEHQDWTQRSLVGQQYVYWWADGIDTALREDDDERLCLLVILGVTPEGKKEWVAISDGFRESTESWLDVLRDLKAQGLTLGPRLAVGDGALGFWSALEQVYPETTHQRCWFHKSGNVLAD
jgi:transposase-like protein